MKFKIKQHSFLLIAIILIMSILFGVILCVFFSYENCNPIEKTNRYFKNQWDIVLPKITDIEYENSEPGWFADGVRFYIYQIEVVDDISGFSKDKNMQMEKHVSKNLSNLSAIEGHEIPQKYLPDWENEYFWLHRGNYYDEQYKTYNENLYVYYFSTNSLLYICESLF